ncbi:uncharacterized protein TNCV_3174481 [Trichonephila clavipes]|nr:uncharacterized protein TNCV_3174481 [Trichonephila clavipes]
MTHAASHYGVSKLEHGHRDVGGKKRFLFPVKGSVSLRCKRCRMPSSRKPLVWLVQGEEMWEASDHPQSVLPLNWGGSEPNRTVTCMVFKATSNDRRHLALYHDESHGT